MTAFVTTVNGMANDTSTPVGAGTFGGLVRAYRQRRGLTQRQVAAHCDMPRQYVSAVERGQVREVAEERALPWAGVLRIPPEQLARLGIVTETQSRLLRLVGSVGMTTRSWTTGEVSLALTLEDLGELAAVAVALAGQGQAAARYVAAEVRWLLWLIDCHTYRLKPSDDSCDLSY